MITKYLYILSSLLLSIVYLLNVNDIFGKDKQKGIENLTKWGLIPFSLLSAIRHFMSNNKGNAHFYELEAGGTNLAIGVAAILSNYNNLSSIYLIYGIYLLVAMIVSIIHKRSSIQIISFVGIIFMMLSTSYLSL